jgi:hypothetical protein
VQDVPPPVVDIGPTNQTLATRSAATLPCQASGIPLPTIKWYRNGNYLSPDDPRVTITSSGTLQIDGKFLSYCNTHILTLISYEICIIILLWSYQKYDIVQASEIGGLQKKNNWTA